MKKVLLSVVAVTAMATALPVLAQPYGNAYGHPSNRGYNQGYGGFTPMSQRADRLMERIHRGVQSGQITRSEARRLQARLHQVVQMERHFLRDGRLSQWERNELDRQFDIVRAQIRYERRDDDRRGRDWDDDRRGRDWDDDRRPW